MAEVLEEATVFKYFSNLDMPMQALVIIRVCHLSKLLSFSYSNLEFVFHGKMHHRFFDILQNKLSRQVIFFWYDWLPHLFDVERFATPNYLYFLYNNFHRNIQEYKPSLSFFFV